MIRPIVHAQTAESLENETLMRYLLPQSEIRTTCLERRLAGRETGFRISLMAFVTGENPCYDWGMSRDTQALLEAFEHLPAVEKRAFTEELLRRSLPFDFGPLENEEISAASSALFESLEEEDANPRRLMFPYQG